MLHFAGENDPLVKYSWQVMMIEAVKRLNHCETKSEPWEGKAQLYPSPEKAPVVTFIHSGGTNITRTRRN